MSRISSIRNKITTWLVAKGVGEGILAKEWEVEEDDDYIIAHLPDYNFTIAIKVDKRFVNFYLFTGIVSTKLAPHIRLKLYEELLRLNERIQMIKFSLVGEEGLVVGEIDMESASVDYDSVDDALTSLLMGMDYLAKDGFYEFLSMDMKMDMEIEIKIKGLPTERYIW